MAPVVSSLESEGVLGSPCRCEHNVEPVSVSSVIAIGLEHGIHVDTGGLLVCDPVLGVEEFRFVGDGLAGQLEIVGHVGCSVLGCTCLGGDENYTVTCLGAVDGCRSGVLQNLY